MLRCTAIYGLGLGCAIWFLLLWVQGSLCHVQGFQNKVSRNSDVLTSPVTPPSLDTLPCSVIAKPSPDPSSTLEGSWDFATATPRPRHPPHLRDGDSSFVGARADAADFQIVFGVGTGRCGTVSLYKLLKVQPFSIVTHEDRTLQPPPRWVDPSQVAAIQSLVKSRVAAYRSMRGQYGNMLVGDVWCARRGGEERVGWFLGRNGRIRASGIVWDQRMVWGQ